MFLFRTEQTAVARVRIECQHRDTGFDDAEIRLERRTQLFEPCDDLLPGQVVADLGDRDVDRDQSHAEQVAAHHHQGFAAQLGRQKFGVSRIAEVVRLDRLLVDRSRDQCIELFVPQVAHGGVERLGCRPARLRRGRTRLDLRFVAAENQVDLAPAYLVYRRGDMEGDGFQIGDGFLVKFRRFQGSVDDGRAEFRHTRIGESLENDFPADAVRITLRDAYFESVFRHK